MTLGEKIKKLREQKGLLQKQVASDLGIEYTTYNKIENGTRDITIPELDRLAKFFGLTIDQIINNEDNVPVEISIHDKASFEQLNLINQLDDEDKNCVFKIIDTMLTKQKFKAFFQEQLGT